MLHGMRDSNHSYDSSLFPLAASSLVLLQSRRGRGRPCGLSKRETHQQGGALHNHQGEQLFVARYRYPYASLRGCRTPRAPHTSSVLQSE